MENDLIVLGQDDASLLAAAEAYAARAPYIWRPSGEKLSAIAAVCAGSQLSGVTYLKGKAGINRAFLTCSNSVTQSALDDALKTAAWPAFTNSWHRRRRRLGHSRQRSAGHSAAPPAAAAGAAAADAAAAGGDAEAAGPARLDLATLYTMRGLFRGTARMPIPSNLDGQLYVPAGAAGIAMANLAARMGVETTGITLPLATPAPAAAVRDVRTKSVVEASSDLGKEAERKFFEEDTASQERTRAFGRRRRTPRGGQGIRQAALGAGARR